MRGVINKKMKYDNNTYKLNNEQINCGTKKKQRTNTKTHLKQVFQYKHSTIFCIKTQTKNVITNLLYIDNLYLKSHSQKIKHNRNLYK